VLLAMVSIAVGMFLTAVGWPLVLSIALIGGIFFGFVAWQIRPARLTR
jgi:nitrate reductase NapE component